MYLEIAKLVIDLAKDIRSALRKKEKNRLSAIEIGTLLELYGSATRIEFYANNVIQILDNKRERFNKNEEDSVIRLLREIADFATHLFAMNLSVFDIYYPGLNQALTDLYYHEGGSINFLSNYLPEESKEQKEALSKLKKLYSKNKELYILTSQLTHDLHDKYYKPYVKERIFMEKGKGKLRGMADLASKYRALIGQIIKDNWDLKELSKI